MVVGEEFVDLIDVPTPSCTLDQELFTLVRQTKSVYGPLFSTKKGAFRFSGHGEICRHGGNRGSGRFQKALKLWLTQKARWLERKAFIIHRGCVRFFKLARAILTPRGVLDHFSSHRALFAFPACPFPAGSACRCPRAFARPDRPCLVTFFPGRNPSRGSIS